jgi:hypothetical protein
MDQLRDITGLQPTSWWPLAIGWWIVILLVSTALIYGLIWWCRRYIFYRSWQGKAYKNLLQLERGLEASNLKLSLQELSAEIRQIAIYTSTRQDCAALTANNWLEWLQDHDPQGYQWTQAGQLLIAAQYAPVESYSMQQVLDMIAAIKQWVSK